MKIDKFDDLNLFLKDNIKVALTLLLLSFIIILLLSSINFH